MKQPQERIYDVLVIGAGIAGCCVARELSRYDLNAVVLEAGNDIAQGATRANSGIVHAGYDPEPGTTKAHYNVLGSKIFPQWAEELGFSFINNGSLVVAFSDDELSRVQSLVERAQENGVEGVRKIDVEELHSLEPQVSPDALGALYAPTAAICDPYGVAFAAAENAAQNGLEFLFNERVINIEVSHAPENKWRFCVKSESGSSFKAKLLVNAAGIFSDEINNLASAHKLSIKPRRGEYRLYDTEFGKCFSHTVFQAPSAVGKGVLITPTVHGNLLVGPNAVDQESKEDVSTTEEGLEFVLAEAKKTWPDLSAQGTISNFAGLRSRGETADFVIGEAPDVPGFFNIACFDSPGLSCAPAVALDIAQSISKALQAAPNKDFNPIRRPAPLFAHMSEDERAKAIEQNPRHGHIVCRCCEVTEADLVTLMHSPIPVNSVDALKWRSMITMGRCHGGFCTPELIHIMARELNLSPHAIDKRLAGSCVVSDNRRDYLDISQASRESVNLVCASSQAFSEQGADTCFDVVVVGGGAAGIAAARKAAQEGADVLLIDREQELGGILKQCIHSGFGLDRFKKELTGPEYAQIEIDSLFEEKIEVLRGASVMRVRRKDSSQLYELVVVSPLGEFFISSKAVVLATGSRERGLGALSIAGTRPSGVFSAGSAQNLINLQGCLPGRDVVILGSGDIGLIMARRLTLQGARVLGVYEKMPYPSGLRRNIVQCLDDYGIPLHLSRTVVRLEGDTRLEALIISQVDPQTLEVISGTEERVACDTLLLSVGLIPENELAKTLGLPLDEVTGGAIVDNGLATDLPGVFECGNALHVHDLVDFVSQEGESAGFSAAKYAQQNMNSSEAKANDFSKERKVIAGEHIRYVIPQKITLNQAEDDKISFSLRTDSILDKPRFRVEGIDATGKLQSLKVFRTKVAVPAEMIQIDISQTELSAFDEIRLSAEGS
ncbi:MAG: FAD-dependent oxidoreductase [Raoultibacter sp.]|jgi:glycerol-3-phosphate dehydrogenase